MSIVIKNIIAFTYIAEEQPSCVHLGEHNFMIDCKNA